MALALASTLALALILPLSPTSYLVTGAAPAQASSDVARRHLKGLLEALVFASDKPMPEGELAKQAGAEKKLVKELDAMKDDDADVRTSRLGAHFPLGAAHLRERAKRAVIHEAQPRAVARAAVPGAAAPGRRQHGHLHLAAGAGVGRGRASQRRRAVAARGNRASAA